MIVLVKDIVFEIRDRFDTEIETGESLEPRVIEEDSTWSCHGV